MHYLALLYLLGKYKNVHKISYLTAKTNQNKKKCKHKHKSKN